METQQVAIRLSLDVIERVDAFAQKSAPPGVTLTRSDAIRMLIELGLKAASKKR